MSFIAITYGYNLYSIFNTNTTTLPLIDRIKLTCFENLIGTLTSKQDALTKEINGMKLEDENLKKQSKALTDKYKVTITIQ